MSNNKSKTTSQLLKSKSPTPDAIDRRSQKKKLVNLQDIDSILTQLETENSQRDSKVRRVCNCMARRHPLFEFAPNCLNCGKIICTKEGLQPCSFCGSDIIPPKDRDAIVKLLEKEKEELVTKKQELYNPSLQKTKKKIVVKMNAGEKFWDAQDRAFKLAEKELQSKKSTGLVAENASGTKETKDQDLQKAKERLETLLDYQATGEERTKIIDNASDFEMPSQSLWLTPEERALNLKKQQRLMRESLVNKERKSRGEKTVEMTIKDGKVTMVEKYVTHTEGTSHEESELEKSIKEKKMQSQTSNLVWDYEMDKSKWEKPIYFASKDIPQVDKSELKITKNRVQFPKEDASEVIATVIN